MLSKFDIQKELGKEICVFPLDLSNIKENSINLCAGKFAWSMATREVVFSIKNWITSLPFKRQKQEIFFN